MATDLEVRRAIAETLDGIPGWRAHGLLPGQIHPPAMIIIEVDVEFDLAMQRGGDRFLAVVRLLASGDQESVETTLSEGVYLARDRIHEDPELGDVAHDSRMVRKRGDSEGQINLEGALYGVVDVEIEVIA